MANEDQGCCPEKVEMLIQDENSLFTEDDRDWLLIQSEDVIEKLWPVIVEKEVVKEVIKEVKINTETPVTKEQIVQVLEESFSDQAKFLALLPSNMRDQMESGLKLHQEKREGIIASILANQAGDAWGKDELSAMNMQTLDKIMKSIPLKRDFSGQGGGTPNVNAQAEEMLLPPGL